MKKVLKGIFITLGVVMAVSLVGCVGSMWLLGTAVNESIEEMEQESMETNATYDSLVQAIEWSYVTDSYGDTTVTGELTNTTDKEIEYIHIEYKFIKDGVTVDSSWTNAINIEPNETVEIEIITLEDFDSMQVKGTDGL